MSAGVVHKLDGRNAYYNWVYLRCGQFGRPSYSEYWRDVTCKKCLSMKRKRA